MITLKLNIESDNYNIKQNFTKISSSALRTLGIYTGTEYYGEDLFDNLKNGYCDNLDNKKIDGFKQLQVCLNVIKSAKSNNLNSDTLIGLCNDTINIINDNLLKVDDNQTDGQIYIIQNAYHLFEKIDMNLLSIKKIINVYIKDNQNSELEICVSNLLRNIEYKYIDFISLFLISALYKLYLNYDFNGKLDATVYGED